MNSSESELMTLVFVKMSQFQDRYKTDPNNIVLPIFLKELVFSLEKSGKFVFMDRDKMKIIGLTINWSKINSLEVIQCFDKII